jgi:predicted phosphodiesterase
MSKVFVISDLHLPFHNKAAYKHMLAELKETKPTHVVQVGDLLDQYVFSRYSRTLEVTPAGEIKRGLKAARDMWAEIARIVPKAKRVQILGNHDVRMKKRIMDRLPELETLAADLYQFEGVATLNSDRDYVEIDGVVYVHGWLSKSIDHAKHFNKPTVHGHRHRPAIEVDRPGLWSMDVGFMADEASAPLQYTMNKLTRWTLACGVVENGQPRLIFLKGGKK